MASKRTKHPARRMHPAPFAEPRRVDLAALIGRGYRAFWHCRKRYRVVKGGKASKKSTTAALWFIVHLMKYPQANLLVVRRVCNTHRQSTFAQLRWAIKRLGVQHLWSHRLTPLELTYIPTGQRILFRGFDDVDKLASTTVDEGYLCWVWVEEAFEIDRLADFEKLDLSVPRGDVPYPLFKQTTLTFNPWNERHWLKARFFDTRHPDTLTMTVNYLCNDFLDETDRAVYERLKLEHPRRYTVAGLGEWGVSDGLVYDRWEVAEFDVRTLADGSRPDAWKFRHVFGLDYGYTNDPTAFVAMAVNPVDKVLWIYDEHYETHMLNDAIAAMITQKGYAKERIRADSSEPKSNDDLRRLGLARLASARKGRDSVLNGIAKLQEYRMIVHPRCHHTIEELSSYQWRTDNSGDKAVNHPEDRHNHLMDAMRYAMEDLLYFHPRLPRPDAGATARDRATFARNFRGGWDA